jgi:hypothetical protein
MKRLLRRAIFCLVPAAVAAFTFGIPAASSDLGLQNTSLACNDGTNLNLALGAAGIAALTDAVSAMSLYPAGNPALACSLSQPTAPSGGGGKKDFVVGGGQFSGTGATCVEANFALNGHVDVASNGSAGYGTFEMTERAAQNICGQGHLSVKIDCVKVGGQGPGTAQVTGLTTKATGDLAGFFTANVTEVRVDVIDSGLPGGTGDTIGIKRVTFPCDGGFSGVISEDPVDKGNIHVHQAS